MAAATVIEVLAAVVSDANVSFCPIPVTAA